MTELFKEFAGRYESKRREFLKQLIIKKPWYRLDLEQAAQPKVEEIAAKEQAFYKEVIEDMKGIRSIRGVRVDVEAWKGVMLFLDNYNERLAAQIDSAGAYFSVLALLAAFFTILAQSVAPSNWVSVLMVMFFAFFAYRDRVSKRHDLARNKELGNILRQFLVEQPAQSRNAQ